MTSIHDQVIALVRGGDPDSVPEDFKDLLGTFVSLCEETYGDSGRDRAVEILEIQKQKGLETYGVPLTATTPVNGRSEGLAEYADFLVYELLGWIQRGIVKAQSPQLTTEQQFQIVSFNMQTDQMSLSQAQSLLKSIHQQMIVKDAIYQELLRKNWGLTNGHHVD